MDDNLGLSNVYFFCYGGIRALEDRQVSHCLLKPSLSLTRNHRDSAPNRAVALMKFRTAEYASEFREEFNGRFFNSMEV